MDTNNSRTRTLTTSQVKCFKSCRMRYFLEYVENLKPVATPTPLEIGTLYHFGLELLLNGERDKGRIAMEITAKARTQAESRGVDIDIMNAEIAAAMVRAFIDADPLRDAEIVEVEKTFDVATGYAKRLAGKIDGIVTMPDIGKTFLLEHKTTSVWGTDGAAYLDHLLWDEQSTNYLYAYQRMLEDGVISGGPVEGILYVIVEKPTIKPYKATPMEQRKYTKDGSLYKTQHEEDETLCDFLTRVDEWYRERPRVHVSLVYRTQEDIADHIGDLNACIRDIATAERDGTWYRNPQACSILGCPYRPKCLENLPETDELFVKKTSTNEELEVKDAEAN